MEIVTKERIRDDQIEEYSDCDSIERKLDLLIDRQEAKLCQCDEEGVTNELKLPL